jgi:bifunctional pyridoxal-dependent enzyme with beta-cystathionase and maltose regulon repressor activities
MSYDELNKRLWGLSLCAKLAEWKVVPPARFQRTPLASASKTFHLANLKCSAASISLKTDLPASEFRTWRRSSIFSSETLRAGTKEKAQA